jgi:methionyl-tRNA formyltransferase
MPAGGRARGRRRLFAAAAAARARQGAEASPVQPKAEAALASRSDPPHLAMRRKQEAFAALEPRCCGGGTLRLILPQPVLERAAASAASTFTPRCCRDGGGRRRSSGRSLPAISGRACTIMGWSAGSTPADVRCAGDDVGRKTAGELTAELAAGWGAALMVEVLERLAELRPTPQPEEGVTYAPKIEKHEARLDSAARLPRSSGRCAPSTRRRARSSSCQASGSGCWRRRWPGSPGPAGGVLDERLTIACGTGAIMPASSSARARRHDVIGAASRLPDPGGTRLG